MKPVNLKKEDLELLPVRDPEGNKGTFGRVLVAAGCRNMAGAAFLSAYAAYRSGAGLVHIISPEDNRVILQTLIPEAILSSYDARKLDISMVSHALDKADSVVIGPGLGTSEAARELLHYIMLSGDKRMVIDADALNLIAVTPDFAGLISPNMILTPHIREFSRLTGRSVNDIKAHPFELASEFAETYNTTLVLKDADTYIVSCDGSAYVNTLGNSGMATGGSGDVLAGITGALLADKTMSVSDAARYAVLMHATAGDAAASARSERSILARDIAENIR